MIKDILVVEGVKSPFEFYDRDDGVSREVIMGYKVVHQRHECLSEKFLNLTNRNEYQCFYNIR